ncbi:hypothetical protein BDP27DRAFT_1449104 [Rhodocollybia butyracea]|uniref:Uncharacterized protein n=1 Tax=Rhodocollybia butyracea TaxID=206335 RepID=A0A9P5PSY8_9AGAR|nr:hypothetical protein BDP27DRAFT_1449104 [Rhodocollybia butyracea]
MHAILLLFTLMSGFILAVFPVPVPAGPSEAIQSLSPRTSRSIPIISFINDEGQNLGTDPTRFGKGPTETYLRAALNKAFGWAENMEIKFRGSYSRSGGRSWRYITVTGVDDKCTESQPCYGWLARGYLIGIDLKRHGKHGTWYVGIAVGEPRRGQFESIMGQPARPPQTLSPHTELVQKEWNQLSKEFVGHFMVPTMAFTNINGKLLSGQEVPLVPDSSLTGQINQALKVENYEITYHAYSLQTRSFFQLVRVSICTTVNPCFGFIKQLDITLHHHKRHIFIVQPKVPGPDSERFKLVGLYPSDMDTKWRDETMAMLEKDFRRVF